MSYSDDHDYGRWVAHEYFTSPGVSFKVREGKWKFYVWTGYHGFILNQDIIACSKQPTLPVEIFIMVKDGRWKLTRE